MSRSLRLFTPPVAICAFEAGEDTPLHVFAEVSGVNPVLDTSQLHRARAKSRS
jgi:hypothetical protein